MQLLENPRAARRAAAEAYSPTPEESAALAVLNERFDQDDPVKQGLEQQWLTNIAFLRGFQYMNWDPLQKQLVYTSTRSLKWRAKSVHNMVRPYVERAISTLADFRPRFKASPATADPEDQQRADACEAVAAHYWDALKMPRKKYDLLYWIKVCGNGFLKTVWDPAAGADITDTQQVEVDGQMVTVEDVQHEGDVSTEVVSPLSIYLDNYAEDIDDIEWMMQVEARPLEWVERHFPERAAQVPPGLAEEATFQNRRWVVSGGAFSGSTGATGKRRDWVLYKEYWERPSLDYPRGRLIIAANGVILRTGDNPLRRLPFVWFRDSLIPGLVWGQCDVDNMLPMQRAYNRLRSKKLEHIVHTANAKIREHAMNKLPDTAWITEIGEVLRWNGVIAPDYLVPPPLPNDIDAESAQILGDFDRATSQYGPARGQYQGKLSGKAIYTLIEQDLQSKEPAVERLGEGLAEWAKQVIEIARDNVLETRLLKVVGRGHSWDIKEFKGTDVEGGVDVSIDIDSIRPKSRAMAMEMATALTQAGWLSPGSSDDRARVWKMLKMEDDAPLYEDKNLDIRRATLENKQMMLGIVVEPAQWYDDQDVHMLKHTELQKSDEYKDAPPIVRALVDSHVKSHLDIVRPQVGVTVAPEEMSMESAPPPQRGGGGQPSGGGQQRAAPPEPYT